MPTLPSPPPLSTARCEPDDHVHAEPEPAAFSRQAFERAAEVLNAAGEPERLRLLERLLRGELCVTELAQQVDGGLSTISQRLRLLRQAGLVRRRRQGKHVYYALADGHVRDLVSTILAHAQEDTPPSSLRSRG